MPGDLSWYVNHLSWKQTKDQNLLQLRLYLEHKHTKWDITSLKNTSKHLYSISKRFFSTANFPEVCLIRMGWMGEQRHKESYLNALPLIFLIIFTGNITFLSVTATKIW